MKLRFLLALGTVGAMVCGCDYARFGTQRVEIEVTRPASGLPVPNAIVTCAPTKREGPLTLYELPVDEYLDTFSDKSQVTDSSGRAVFAQDVFVLRGGILVWLRLDPLKLEDTITGETYYFGIEEDTRETLIVRMVPGTSVEGERFVLAVDAVEAPKPKSRAPVE